MMKRNSGFSLIELLITIAILGMVLAGVSQIFSGIFMVYRQQSSIAETSIEGNLGLELLRQDLASAGYGIPWVVPAGVSYNEAAGAGAPYNDSVPPGDYYAPRAIVNGDGSGIDIPGSDELIIKSVSIARNDACKKWSYIRSDPTVTVKTWDVASENPAGSDHVIAISPGITDDTRRTLVTSTANATEWHTTFGATANYAPPAFSNNTNFLYTVSSSTIPRMPFNRADYYISTSGVPKRCATGTGVLVKMVISHADGVRRDPMPLLDCVKDLQVIFRRDALPLGALDGVVDTTSPLSHDLGDPSLYAKNVRDQVKEVRVYILAHEGERDRSYVHGAADIYVGDASLGQGHIVNISGDARNYRWKVYTIAVKPFNLR